MNKMKTAAVHDTKKRDRILTCAAVALGAVLLFLTDQGILMDAYGQRIVKLCAVFAIAALSMTLIQGLTGQFSLGQAGFMAVGAYVTALCTVPPDTKVQLFYVEPAYSWVEHLQLPFPVAILLGGLFAAFAAFLIGFPVLRLKSDYLGIASLGFSEIIRILIVNATRITNSSLGIKNIPSFANVWWCVGSLAVVVVFLLRMMRTSYGRAFKSIRDDEIAAQAMGINLFTHKLKSFVISGFLAGLSGALLASVVGVITPTYFRFTLAYEILLIVVLGGMGSITGAVIAASVITVAKELLRFLDEGFSLGFFAVPAISGMRMLVFSILLMVVILFFREGFFGSREFSWQGLFDSVRRLGAKCAALLGKKKKGGEAV